MLQNVKYTIFWIVIYLFFCFLQKKIDDRSVLSANDSMPMTSAWFRLFTIFVGLLNFDLFIISFLLKNFLKNEMRVQWFSLFGIFRLFLFFTISHDLFFRKMVMRADFICFENVKKCKESIVIFIFFLFFTINFRVLLTNVDKRAQCFWGDKDCNEITVQTYFFTLLSWPFLLAIFGCILVSFNFCGTGKIWRNGHDSRVFLSQKICIFDKKTTFPKFCDKKSQNLISIFFTKRQYFHHHFEEKMSGCIKIRRKDVDMMVVKK